MGTFLPPEDLPDPGIKNVTPMSPELPADSLPTEPSGKPPNISIYVNINICYKNILKEVLIILP